VLEVSSSGGSAKLKLPTTWTAAHTWNVEYLKPYQPTSSIEFAESAENLSDVAVRDDSIQIGNQHPISVPSTSTTHLPSHVSSEGMEAAMPIVERIMDYKKARGQRSAQFLLTFKDRPASENVWVDVSLCPTYSGFDVAFAAREARIQARRNAPMPSPSHTT
jgi:hypothetical protein